MCFVVFFFQAEDGIRYLVRSRGLGDVYKRQPHEITAGLTGVVELSLGSMLLQEGGAIGRVGGGAVSYTHLTLPTSDLV